MITRAKISLIHAYRVSFLKEIVGHLDQILDI